LKLFLRIKLFRSFKDLEFSGDLNYLRVYWNTTYLGEAPQQIGVKCYFNCNPLTDPNKCVGQQNCTYLGPPGPAVCSIQPVTYNSPLDADNLAVCIFYNPAQPSVEYKKA
jgi:hypothetical protein